MLLIYIPNATPRHHYVFNHIMSYLGIEYLITDDVEAFADADNLKFSYDKKPLHDEMHFYAHGLLNESSINIFSPTVDTYRNISTLFSHAEITAALPYDVFSAVFYMLSRYEEYLPFTADAHGRFEAAHSLAYKHDFLQRPVVDHWIQHLAEVLQQYFPDLKLKNHKYAFIPTYDIDQAYAYKHKGFVRTIGGLLRDKFRLNLRAYFERLGVLLHLKTDPFDSYAYQFTLQQTHDLHPIYFFHAGTYGKYDKNTSPENKHIRRLLNTISQHASLGIHPSYLSAEHPELLAAEIERLSLSSYKKIISARQHFIKISFPETYRNYIANGITDDYSMGYATNIGFRAGTSQAFYFFDLLDNASTPLLIHPFAFMEGVFKQYKPTTSKEILEVVEPMIAEIKQLKGTFISIWHNESLGTSRQWIGWRDVYEKMLVLARY